MALSLSTFDNVLKDFYEGAIRETLNSEVPLFKHLDESDKEWSGRRVVWPVHTARNSGVGARADAGTLPSAGNQTHLLSVVSSTYQYLRIQVTGPTIRAGKNAFAEAMASEMDGGVKDFRNDLGRQTWGTGDGRLAQVGADVAADLTTATVYNRFFESGQPGARYLYQEQLLDGGTVASPTADGSVKVVSISVSNSPGTTVDTIVTSGSHGAWSQCETFFFNRGAGGAGIEMNGVLALVDDYTQSNFWGSNAFAGSAIQGINRAANSQWNSIILANSGTERIIDGNLIQQAFDRVNIESGEDPDMIMGEHGVVRAFLDHVSSDRRYGTMNFDAGMSALSYNGVQIERDRQAPYNSLLVFKRDALKLYTLLDFEWADDDGSILSRVSNQDAFEAFLRSYRQIGLDKSPKCLAMIRDIRVD